MIAAVRITRRLVRKIVKPFALWLNTRALARAEARAEHFYCLRVQSVPMELDERKRQIALTARRREISNW